MTFVNAVTIDTPPFKYSTDEIRAAAAQWLQANSDQRALFDRLSGSAQIDNRAFALPIQQLLGLSGASERARVFDQVGTSLLESVMGSALQELKLTPADVGAVVFTSCSVPAIPSIDVKAIASLGMSPSVIRMPLFQHGCAGGAIGLSLAHQMRPIDGVTLLGSVELCSLIYQGEDLTGGNLVGSALFGDGAACAVLSNRPGPLEILARESYLIPGTYHLMGYDIHDNGTHLKLDREVPQCLSREAPGFIRNFLAAREMSPSDIKWWIFHPGGSKILSSLESSLELSREQTRWGWNVLRENGNMSSASVLFAISNFLSERPYQPGDKALMLGVGPGLTLEAMLFDCKE